MQQRQSQLQQPPQQQAMVVSSPPPAWMGPLAVPYASLRDSTLSFWSTTFPPRPLIDASPPSQREYAACGRSLLVASFPRLFVCLAMVWNYPVPFLRMVTLFTLSSHASALQALCDCPPVEAAALVAGGYAAALAVRLLCVQVGLVSAVPSYFF